MPDITMCHDNRCPMRRECYRSPWSGTVPDPEYQSWFVESPRRNHDQCEYHWPPIKVEYDDDN